MHQSILLMGYKSWTSSRCACGEVNRNHTVDTRFTQSFLLNQSINYLASATFDCKSKRFSCRMVILCLFSGSLICTSSPWNWICFLSHFTFYLKISSKTTSEVEFHIKDFEECMFGLGKFGLFDFGFEDLFLEFFTNNLFLLLIREDLDCLFRFLYEFPGWGFGFLWSILKLNLFYFSILHYALSAAWSLEVLDWCDHRESWRTEVTNFLNCRSERWPFLRVK